MSNYPPNNPNPQQMDWDQGGQRMQTQQNPMYPSGPPNNFVSQGSAGMPSRLGNSGSPVPLQGQRQPQGQPQGQYVSNLTMQRAGAGGYQPHMAASTGTSSPLLIRPDVQQGRVQGQGYGQRQGMMQQETYGTEPPRSYAPQRSSGEFQALSASSLQHQQGYFGQQQQQQQQLPNLPQRQSSPSQQQMIQQPQVQQPHQVLSHQQQYQHQQGMTTNGNMMDPTSQNNPYFHGPSHPHAISPFPNGPTFSSTPPPGTAGMYGYGMAMANASYAPHPSANGMSYNNSKTLGSAVSGGYSNMPQIGSPVRSQPQYLGQPQQHGFSPKDHYFSVGGIAQSPSLKKWIPWIFAIGFMFVMYTFFYVPRHARRAGANLPGQGFHLQTPMQPLKEDDVVAAGGGGDVIGSSSSVTSGSSFTVASVMRGSNTIGANSSTEQRNMVKGKIWKTMTNEEKQVFRGIVGHSVPPNAFDELGGYITLASRQTLKRLIVCERSKMIFCPIPKVGNSAWKYLLRKLEGHEDKADIQVVNDRRKSGLTYLDSYQPEDVIALLSDPAYMKVVFVRDPFTRELSAYLNKFVEKAIDSQEYDLFMKQLFGFNYFKTRTVTEFGRLSFEQFVKQMANQGAGQMNEHWAPQTHLCSMDLLSYDYVGHFENMQNDSRLLLDTLGFKHRYLPSQEEIHFIGTSAAHHHTRYYNAELVQTIKSKFANDFNYLGYSAELELGPESGTLARGEVATAPPVVANAAVGGGEVQAAAAAPAEGNNGGGTPLDGAVATNPPQAGSSTAAA